MEAALSQYIKSENLFQTGERVLIALSGGVDSTVLCFLMKNLNIDLGFAHCNFLLRKNFSNEDELFTNELSQKLSVNFYSTRFETEKIAKDRKQSIQVAARELRYEWLEKIRVKHAYDYIATAHHLNDSIETAIYNFTKGCGIRGLHGIRPKVGKIIRPLLYATKEQILTYAQENEILFREDASNASDKYARNKIRHQVTPSLKTINPSFEQSAATTIRNLSDTELLFDFFLEKIRKKIITEENNISKINIQKLLEYPASRTVLFELLRPYNFNAEQVAQILERINEQAGSRFYSPTHELLIDRIHLMIRPKKESEETSLYALQIDDVLDLEDGKLELELQEELPERLKTVPTIAFLDMANLTFPLKLRHWEAGDWFQPLGLRGKRKKLKDFFTDQKLSRFEKEQLWIVESSGEICWIVGYRIDERFKITPDTKQCIKLVFTKKS